MQKTNRTGMTLTCYEIHKIHNNEHEKTQPEIMEWKISKEAMDVLRSYHIQLLHGMVGGWSFKTVEDTTDGREKVIRNRKLKNSTPSLNRILMPLLYLLLMLLLLLFALNNIFTSSLLSRCLIHWPEFGKWTTVFSYGFFNCTIWDWLFKRVSVVSLQQCPFKFLFNNILFAQCRVVHCDWFWWLKQMHKINF